MVAWLLVCVSEAETARREKRVRRRTKKKRSGKYIYITGEKKKKKKKVGSGTRRIGLNWYPLKQAGGGGKRVFLTGRGG